MLNSKIRISLCVYPRSRNPTGMHFFFLQCRHLIKEKKSTLNEHQRSVVKRRDRSVEMFPCLLSPAVVPMPDMIVKPFCSLSQCPLGNSVETISWGFSCVSHFFNGTSKQVSTVAMCLLLLASLSHCH